MGNIYGNTIIINSLKADGFRIIADGTIKLNILKIPISTRLPVNGSSPKLELDLNNIKSDGRMI